MNRYAGALLIAVFGAGGCAHATNYTSPVGPRYAGRHETGGRAGPCLRMVSFNIAYGQFPDRAIFLLRKDTVLRRADVLLLQEVDAASTAMIADSLDMSWVYYPAVKHPFTGRDFGNAILSRWPIEDDAKIVLPHLGKFGGTQRIAVGATVRYGGRSLRVYSLHLATGVTNGKAQRQDQLRTVAADAERYEYAAIGGDFNSSSLPRTAEAMGFAWPTQHIPATAAFWTVDHVLLHDLQLCGRKTVGVRKDPFDTSDHLPIWIDLAFSPPDQIASHAK